jgi:hypothetical protein
LNVAPRDVAVFDSRPAFSISVCFPVSTRLKFYFLATPVLPWQSPKHMIVLTALSLRLTLTLTLAEPLLCTSIFSDLFLRRLDFPHSVIINSPCSMPMG